jgi:hypothetical protein
MRVSRLIGLVLVLVLVASIKANAQGKKTTTSRDTTVGVSMAPPNMAAMMDSIGPVFSTVMGGMYGGIIDYLARPETAAKLATFAKNYFDELIKRGFTREEALLLVRGVGIPGPMGR